LTSGRPPAYGRRDVWERRALYALVVVLVVLIMFPFAWLLTMSFKTDQDIFAFPPKLFFAPTLDNYTALWDTGFRTSFANSAIASTVSTLLAMLVGVPGAYALSRTTMRAEGALSLLILASRMAPPIAFTIPYFLVYRHIELLDTLTGLVIIYLTFNLSLVIWLMRSFFDATPRSLEEAAWIDGAGLWQGFYRIVLPLSGPGLAATAILCFLYSWNDFFFALILTRTEAMTAPVAVVNFMNYEGWEWGKIAAGGTMVMLPVLFFSILVRKFLVHGLTAGALKG
jgi:multiple sugar transport system permease protein